MTDDIKPLDPAVFSGAGLRAVPGEERYAEPIIRRLEETVGFNRADTPWVMAEFVFLTEHPKAIELVRSAVTAHIGVSDMHCPTPPDPEVPATAHLLHPFVVGPTPAPDDLYLLSGRCSDQFLAAWQKYHRVYFELHVWVKRAVPEADESLFLWTVMGHQSPLRVVVRADRPTIVPVDTTRNYRCIYAQKKGWGR